MSGVLGDVGEGNLIEKGGEFGHPRVFPIWGWGQVYSIYCTRVPDLMCPAVTTWSI